MSFTLETCRPEECSHEQLVEFRDFLDCGGQVWPDGLLGRVAAARLLVMLRDDNRVLVGVAALKNPRACYREALEMKACARISEADFPLELGWMHVALEHRGQGYSTRLRQAALDNSRGLGMFSTSTENLVKPHPLLKHGFNQLGVPFLSERDSRRLVVHARTAQHPAERHYVPL